MNKKAVITSVIVGLSIEQTTGGVHSAVEPLKEHPALTITKGPEHELLFTESPHVLEEDFSPQLIRQYAVSTTSAGGGMIFPPYGWEEAANTVIRMANDRRRYHGHLIATFAGPAENPSKCALRWTYSGNSRADILEEITLERMK